LHLGISFVECNGIISSIYKNARVLMNKKQPEDFQHLAEWLLSQISMRHEFARINHRKA